MPLSGVELGIQGVIEARSRWDLAHNQADTTRFTIAVTESIVWAAAVDELLWKHQPYLTYREVSQGGRHLEGLRWARNLGVHECIAAHGADLGYGYPIRHPEPNQFEARWLPRTELRVSESGSQRNQMAYDEHIAGEDVRLSLWAVEDFLTRQGFVDATADVP